MTAGTIEHIEGLAAAAMPWLVCAIGALLVAWSVLLCRQNGAQNGPEVLLGYNYSSPGGHKLYTKCAAQGNAFSGAIALYRAKDGVRGNQAIGQSVWTDAATYDIMGGSF